MRGARRVPRAAAGIGATSLVVAGLLLVESSSDASPAARASRAAGALRVSDSRSGRAILSGHAMLPGDSVSGSVTISNTGSSPGLFELSASSLVDAPGQGGGRLSDGLRLVISDTTARRPSVLYDGTLSHLGVVPVGELGPGAAHLFRFRVTRPAASRQRTFRAASSRIDFVWTAVREESGACANRILGSAAADTLSGSRAGDTVRGGSGSDRIVGGAGRDCLFGEAGDDAIDARDGEADRIDCGPGTDDVLADSEDVVTGCERIHRPTASASPSA